MSNFSPIAHVAESNRGRAMSGDVGEAVETANLNELAGLQL